jgi:hypothetical protein
VVELVNPRTGERLEGEGLEGIPVIGKVRRKRRWTNEFFLAVQSGIERLATHPELTHDARRVFLYMASRVQWENAVSLSQQQIAEGLGIGPARVSRAIKVLVAETFISPKIRETNGKTRTNEPLAVKKGRSVVYELSGGVVWKGTIDRQAEFQRQWKADVERWSGAHIGVDSANTAT